MFRLWQREASSPCTICICSTLVSSVDRAAVAPICFVFCRCGIDTHSGIFHGRIGGVDTHSSIFHGRIRDYIWHDRHIRRGLDRCIRLDGRILRCIAK
jgi:hypothetical protein